MAAITGRATGDLELPRKDQPVKGVAWAEQASGPGMASPVSCQGKLYVVSRGILTCHDAKTGKRLYRSRLQGAANIAASLWSNGDKLFILDESGNTFVVKVGDEFELLSKNSVPGLYWSTPTVVGDSLLLRAADKLHCIRGS